MILGQLNDIDVKLLRVFRHIVECGGMSAAELELNISRSVISRQLKDLEIRLGGLKLCNRGRGGFSLTDDGQRVFNAIMRLHASIDMFRSQISEVHQVLSGNLIIGIGDLTISNKEAHIDVALQLFNQKAPQVTIDIHTQSLKVIEPLVIDGTYHIGIIPFHRKSSSLKYNPLFVEEMCLYCAPSHPLYYADHSIIGWGNIREYAFAGLGYHSPNLELIRENELNCTTTTCEQESIATLIASGNYLGYLPAHYAEQFVANERMRRIENELFNYRVEYCSVTRATTATSRIVEIFLQCLQEAHQSKTH